MPYAVLCISGTEWRISRHTSLWQEISFSAPPPAGRGGVMVPAIVSGPGGGWRREHAGSGDVGPSSLLGRMYIVLT